MKLINKKCILENFRNDISMMEDLVFLLSNSKYIKNFYIIDEYLYNYVQQENSASNHKKFKISDISALKASLLILDYCSDREKIKLKKDFCNTFFMLKSKIDKKDYLNILNKEYLEINDCFYKEVIKSNIITRKEKIKLFLKKHFNCLLKIKYKY